MRSSSDDTVSVIYETENSIALSNNIRLLVKSKYSRMRKKIPVYTFCKVSHPFATCRPWFAQMSKAKLSWRFFHVVNLDTFNSAATSFSFMLSVVESSAACVFLTRMKISIARLDWKILHKWEHNNNWIVVQCEKLWFALLCTLWVELRSDYTLLLEQPPWCKYVALMLLQFWYVHALTYTSLKLYCWLDRA